MNAPTYDELREQLMRCGLLAASERVDGCVPKAAALRIREIAYRACWPDEDYAALPHLLKEPQQ